MPYKVAPVILPVAVNVPPTLIEPATPIPPDVIIAPVVVVVDAVDAVDIIAPDTVNVVNVPKLVIWDCDAVVIVPDKFVALNVAIPVIFDEASKIRALLADAVPTVTPDK